MTEIQQYSRVAEGSSSSTAPASDREPQPAAKTEVDGENRPSMKPLSTGPSEMTLFREIHQTCHIDGRYPLGWIKLTECPCCGSPDLVDFFEKLGMQHSRCIHCDYVGVDPIPPEHVIEALYKGDYYSRMRKFYELPRARDAGLGSAQSAPLDMLEDLIARGVGERVTGSWLEVGGGLGVFANLIRQRAPDWTVSLNERNPHSVQLSRELFGIEALTADVTELAKEGHQFDVISSIAVLEHVPDPVKFITSYTSLLKPGGILISVVPHFTRLNIHVSQASNPNVIPPFHISLFGESNLSMMLQRTNLFSKVETFQRGAASFNIVDHVQHWKYWDALLPDADHPELRAVKIAEYDLDEAVVVNALSTVVDATRDYFARTDGRTHLAAWAVKNDDDQC